MSDTLTIFVVDIRIGDRAFHNCFCVTQSSCFWNPISASEMTGLEDAVISKAAKKWLYQWIPLFTINFAKFSFFNDCQTFAKQWFRISATRTIQVYWTVVGATKIFVLTVYKVATNYCNC